MNVATPARYRFGNFEAEISRCALYENGQRVPIQEKPFLFLATLLQSDGGVVTRDELSRRLWPDTHVQVDQGLNAAARKVRQALHDDTRDPRYLETLGSLGYRFISPIEPLPPETPVEQTALSLHELYLRGRHFWKRRTPEELSKSLHYFEEVVKADPQHALAQAGVADAYNMLATHEIVPPRSGYQQAQQAALRALIIDPHLAEAHVALAWSRLALDYAWPEARRGLEHAIELNPHYEFAYSSYAHLLLAAGEVQSGLATMLRAQQLDPISVPINSVLSNFYFFARQYDKAVEQAELALELDPQFPTAHASLGLACLALGKGCDGILNHFEDAVEYSGEAPIMVAQWAYALAETGHTRRAREMVANLSDPNNSHVPPAFHIALAHLALRDLPATFRWLRRAVEERSHGSLLLHVDPRLDALRLEREFREICDEVRFPGNGIH